MRVLVAGLCVGLALLPAEAGARITGVTITAVEPFAEGATFGEAGAYERVTGVARGEVDPADPRNRGIVNLDKAPRNARGLVEYETDLFMLRPADPAAGNRKLLYEVNNRGRKFLTERFMDARVQSVLQANDPRTAADVGGALTFRMGYTMVWSGWDPDAPRANAGLAMRPVIPREGGAPIVGTIRDELQSGTRGPQVETFRLSHEAASLDPASARLTVRRREADPETEVPAAGWRFVDAVSIKLLPEGAKPEPGSIYQFTYRAKDPKVLGLGFAATRDLVSFLRHGAADDAGRPNPAGAGTKAVLGFGISQSARFMLDYVAQGFNADEQGRKVFDGMLTHTGGIGRVFLNAAFGQPGRTNTQHEDHLYPENEFPFSPAVFEDPLTGRRGSFLRLDGSDPLLMKVNTSTEYWQKGASLLHTDPLGTRDAELPAHVRVYMVAGTQHTGRPWQGTAPGPCVNLRNPHDPTPALRALLVALDRWVSDGAAPPDSQVPRLADGTLVAPDRTGFPALPGFAAASRANAVERPGDWVRPRRGEATPYRPLVAKVDADGNEVAGIRLPDVAVPLATYTGVNLYAAPFPEGELCDRDGSVLAFARTKAEREANGDPRPSVEERYGTAARYAERVEAAVRELVGARLLLPEDAARFVQDARRRTLLD